MRFAALLLCFVLTLAAPFARADGPRHGGADLLLGAGLRAVGVSDGVEGVSRLAVEAPLAEGLAFRGSVDLGLGAGGGSVDLGIGAGFRFDRDHWVAFADLTYDVAAQGATVRTGVDLVARAGSNLTVEAGPRFLVEPGHDGAADDPAGAGAAETSRPLFAGLRLAARYDLGGDWGLDGSISLDRPVLGTPAREGEGAARFGATVMATHRFQLEF